MLAWLFVAIALVAAVAAMAEWMRRRALRRRLIEKLETTIGVMRAVAGVARDEPQTPSDELADSIWGVVAHIGGTAFGRDVIRRMLDQIAEEGPDQWLAQREANALSAIDEIRHGDIRAAEAFAKRTGF